MSCLYCACIILAALYAHSHAVKYDMDHCTPYIEGSRCFKWFRTIRTWNEAEIFCQSLGEGVHLASVRDAAENSFLRTQVLPSYEPFDVMRFGPWLGAKNNGTELFYEWTDGTEFNFANFKDTDDMRTLDQCVRMNLNDDIYIDKVPNGTWHVSTCYDDEHNTVICYKQLEDRDTTTTTTTLKPTEAAQTTVSLTSETTVDSSSVQTTANSTNSGFQDNTLTVALVTGSIILGVLIFILAIIIIVCWKQFRHSQTHEFQVDPLPPPAPSTSPPRLTPRDDKAPVIHAYAAPKAPRQIRPLPTLRAYNFAKPDQVVNEI